ncbi:uncharacterized protein SEPMUDRAFT_149222 [Sphaerulina musiva SO2202]|uniref:Uncharacterized protein n=1 Tax=Sphaerulina musiva (strain SO2202) TaxID=692275 RepID=M3D2Z2_SPHMS|nr:uncharacterized protein SEPMUDRAFT_149222 [Sphaerulina musiva SO2202]EMF12595.1 hypothetical protein SEPMUDRAFT_149222 [Sphaerulina musiva SO2202]
MGNPQAEMVSELKYRPNVCTSVCTSTKLRLRTYCTSRGALRQPANSSATYRPFHCDRLNFRSSVVHNARRLLNSP